MSATTSPRRVSLEVGGLCFFSVPTSPTKRTFKAAYEDSSSNCDELEFETSRRFNIGECEVESQPEEPIPAMAFTDELFCDWKVMPLKPPPRLQYHHKQSLKCQGRESWQSQAKNHRRAPYMSPFRERETDGLSDQSKRSDPNSDKVSESKELQAKRRQLKLAEPKGFVFARRARLVKVGNENKPSVAIAKQQTKGQKMKKLLFRSGSMMCSENNGTWCGDRTEAKPKLKRKFSLKAMGIAPYKEEKRVSNSQVTLTTLINIDPSCCFVWDTGLSM
ncbi:hypothetical protein F3Y22_tig00110260pilonHSYRG00022 [Hibiscus syriacus]|uniref:Uncharacterized protein n=1 Tax=Hibiscus syriacus TaxID=106335 RepID=A0A6A3B905_HIBSY|nr:hypothetical protein F3Y22_tig00110260pilonHSYRG00022 [Hibiscus syriacus]